MREITVIETGSWEADYGYVAQEAIIEHPEHGRLYVTQRYGEAGLAGGCVRWTHGVACSVLPGDTLQSLRAADYNDNVSVYQAMASGYDERRPVSDIGGRAIAALARAAGLADG